MKVIFHIYIGLFGRALSLVVVTARLAYDHCFWQVSDSVCTTVLTMTLSQKKKTALRAVFLLDCPHQT